MLDFMRVSVSCTKKGEIEVYPQFLIRASKDLMIRGSDFYAIWDQNSHFWLTDENSAIELIDAEVEAKYNELMADGSNTNSRITPKYLYNADSGMIDKWHKYCQKQCRDNYHVLDEKLIFSNAIPQKTDYASKQLSYPLEPGSHAAFDEILHTLYSDTEADKIVWAIGSIVAGDSKNIQKFLVFYGSAGTGKSTILNIIQQLFDGYYSVFDAKALGSANASFALEAFRTNPLVAIQHDGDLSRIEDNTRLNSLVSHETMTVNEKFKSTYATRFNAFLFMGTNRPVRITDMKSGIIRRLIDVKPTGNTLALSRYTKLMSQIKFELGAIADYCMQEYEKNPNRYDAYVPTEMMGMTNDFYNFVADKFFTFKKENGTTAKTAYAMYKQWCEESGVAIPMNIRVFRSELSNYFDVYYDTYELDGKLVRGYYHGFRYSKFEYSQADQDIPNKKPEDKKIDIPSWLEMSPNPKNHIFKDVCSDCPAQYANDQGYPFRKWENVKTILKDIDESLLHYVRVPENHIVIDFDIPGADGQKDLKANLAEAAKFPETYAECSKSGSGVHLHYIYQGDVSKLSCIYDDHIEIKVFTGKSSLRRKLILCNEHEISTISSGLPLKGEKPMVSDKAVKSERALRILIKRNLYKEIHPGTKPSIDFIYKILEDAYNSDLKYDVSDMRNAVLAFAANSTHNSQYCVGLVAKMKFKSEERMIQVTPKDETPIAFFDIEVFPNLFLVNYKLQGKDNPVIRLINPKPSDIEELLQYRLVGFNNRKYDNHMIYACMLGYSNLELYKLSQNMIEHKTGFIGEAYGISYTDVYDFSAKKQSLKKFEIELGIHHQELGLPWDQPVPEDMWTKVAEYCDNDVIATEAVFDARYGDFLAREILADIAGGTVNDTTNTLTSRLIFGNVRHPNLVYTNLATGEQTDGSVPNSKYLNAFPGYSFEYHEDDGKWHNMYRGVDLGRGGYITSNQGLWENVAMLDVASLHPHSAIALNAFGEYTAKFEELVNARIAVKHGDYESASKMFDGKLVPYLQDRSNDKNLAQALKIAINSVYGLTSASFDNPFRDIRNKNNIIALRGALFMKTLQDEVESRGYKISAIKTDSIKIINADKEIVDFCFDFARKYGYEFEHESQYEKMFQKNDADYIAKYATEDACKSVYNYIPGDNNGHGGTWTVTGAFYAEPYVLKTLFTHEPITLEDFSQTKAVAKGDIYLDMNEGMQELPDVVKEIKNRQYNDRLYEAARDNPALYSPEIIAKKQKRLNPAYSDESTESLIALEAQGHNYKFVGRIGAFCPVKPGCDGGLLVRKVNGKYDFVQGTKGYRWMETEILRELGKEDIIDRSYFTRLADQAKDEIKEYGDFEWFSA